MQLILLIFFYSVTRQYANRTIWSIISFEISTWMSPRSMSSSSEKKNILFSTLMNRDFIFNRYHRLICNWTKYSSFTSLNLSNDLRIYLIEQLFNEKNFIDDETYCKIRQLYFNSFTRTRWWACLTKNKQQKLKKLLQREDYATTFNVLLPFSNLWSNEIQFDMTKVMIDLKYDKMNQFFLYIMNLSDYQVAEDISLSWSRQKILNRFNSIQQVQYAEDKPYYNENADI